MTRYRVSGAMPVLGHAPGEEFDADLDSGHEARLFQSGALILAADYVPPAPPPKKRSRKQAAAAGNPKPTSQEEPAADADAAPDSEEE